MKDLKHYFADNSRSCESKNVVVDGAEIMDNGENEQICSAEETDERVTSSSTSKKRGRVKIKISRNNTRGKICDIVESQNDLVDKTPSPFGPRDLKDDAISREETPKRFLSREGIKIRGNQEITNLETATNAKNEIANSGDENDNLISNSKSILSVNPKGLESLPSQNSQSRNLESPLAEINKVDREESNAFQVLMTRKKPLTYKSLPAVLPQDEQMQEKVLEESKIKLKKNKEKLIVLADKKGYSKRKLNEVEEAEKIEKRLEKRAKVFRLMATDENTDKSSPALSRIISPGSLHNYFSKTIPDPREKNETMGSCMIVEAEVHTPDSRVPKNIVETLSVSVYPALTVQVSKNKETAESFATSMDFIQVLESPKKPKQNEKPQASQCKKPRWSLRINLPSEEQDNDADATVENAKQQHRGRRDSKSRRVKEKTVNYEESDGNELAGPSVKSLKKKKSSSKVTSSKTAVIEESRISEVTNGIPTGQIAMIPGCGTALEGSEILMVEGKVTSKPGKLAPLFVKRPKLDAAVMEARRAFLTSVPTENQHKKKDCKATNVLPVLPFPAISHVTQLDNEPKPTNLSTERIFPTKEIRPFVPSFDLREFKHVTSLGRQESSKKLGDDTPSTNLNVEKVLEEIESRCSDAREIWARISAKSKDQETPKKSPKKRAKKKKSIDKKNDSSTPDQSNGNCAWTDKYRPTSTREIVGNEEAAETFRKWLAGWKIHPDKNDDSSGDEFYSSDCSYTSNISNNQVAVLLGPHGSGKTATVYAIAEELGYSVLEINASSKRAGKKILKDLEEATKSHRIKRQDFPTLKTISSENERTIRHNSLILVEDVDLIFEEDEGFVSATCQLASNTKRPIVMTGRNVCSHLNRMAPQQHRIYYQNTFGSRVSALLELIALAESGYRLPRPCLDRLLRTGDLRKALLQLQYLLISGKPNVCQVPTNYHQSLWQDMRTCVYKPAIKGAKKSTKKKLDESKSPSSSRSKEKSIMENLANDLDKLSFLSTMIEVDDPAIEISGLKLEPGLSLDENVHDYSSTRVSGFEIAQWLRDRLMNDVITNDYGGNDLQNFRQLSLKKELNASVNLALSQITPHTLDRRWTLLDYLSSLRTICRAEQTRISNTNKRGNRFFHYLNTLRLPALSTTPSILSSACKMMREKDVES